MSRVYTESRIMETASQDVNDTLQMANYILKIVEVKCLQIEAES
jgi:hypothetical protein